MKNNSGFFGGLSSKLLKENFRQQWYLPLLLFILYFLAGIFPLLVLGKDYAGSYAQSCLTNTNFFFPMFMTFAPIIAACVFMRFYHVPERSFALHAQPYSRGKIFNTQIFTGWFMMIIPLVIMGLIYMALSGKMAVQDFSNDEMQWIQAYTVKDAILWFLNSTALFTYMYALCILAGSLVGNTVTQILGCLVFYNLVPALAGIVLMYSSITLKGYAETPEVFYDIILNSDPLAGNLVSLFVGNIRDGSNDIIHLMPQGWYFVIGIALILLAKFACFKGKLERVGDSMIFATVEAIITVVITFIGGALMGILFGFAFEDTGFILVLGALIGAALSFFIVKLILARSIKIFNKTNLKTLIIALVILLVFLTIFLGDLTGFAKRLPSEDQIKTVNTEEVIMDLLPYGELNNVIDNGSKYKDEIEITSDPSFIAKTRAIHKYIIDNKLYDIPSDTKLPIADIYLYYGLENGKKFQRRFTVVVDKELEKMVNDILNTESVKTLRTIPESVKDDIIFAELDLQINKDGQADEYYTGRINKDNIDEILKLIDTYNKEVEANPLVFKAEDLLGRYGTEDEESVEVVYPENEEYVFGYLNIYYNVNDEEKDPYGPTEPSLSMNVPEEYAESIELLRELCDKYPQA